MEENRWQVGDGSCQTTDDGLGRRVAVAVAVAAAAMNYELSAMSYDAVFW